MAENDQQVRPMPQTDHALAKPKHDEESATSDSVESKELRRKKRVKCLLFIVAFTVSQIGVITLFSVTVMKFRTPKFRVRSATFQTFVIETSNSSFNLKMNAELGVKNSNFGGYKYDESTIYFYYKGTQVGSAIVPKSKANFRSTKKLTVAVDLTSTTLPSNSMLASDLTSGFLPLTGQSKLSGKVHLMIIFKKKKSTELSCTMEANISTKALQNVKCK